jgi:hypothetical protein
MFQIFKSHKNMFKTFRKYSTVRFLILIQKIHSTTVLAVRKNNQTILVADGQV